MTALEWAWLSIAPERGEASRAVMNKTALSLMIGSLAWSSAAQAQRVLECRFVSVQPSSFAYGQWSFAADISNGRLAMLLIRPGVDTGPDTGAAYVRAFAPVGDASTSVYHDIASGAGDNGATATFQMATISAGDLVVLDEWKFGGTEQYDRLILKCPSHR